VSPGPWHFSMWRRGSARRGAEPTNRERRNHRKSQPARQCGSTQARPVKRCPQSADSEGGSPGKKGPHHEKKSAGAEGNVLSMSGRAGTAASCFWPNLLHGSAAFNLFLRSHTPHAHKGRCGGGSMVSVPVGAGKRSKTLAQRAISLSPHRYFLNLGNIRDRPFPEHAGPGKPCSVGLSRPTHLPARPRAAGYLRPAESSPGADYQVRR